MQIDGKVQQWKDCLGDIPDEAWAVRAKAHSCEMKRTVKPDDLSPTETDSRQNMVHTQDYTLFFKINQKASFWCYFLNICKL